MYEGMQEKGNTVFGFVSGNSIPGPNGSPINYADVLRIDAGVSEEYVQKKLREIAASKGLTIQAAADFVGPGNIQVPRYQAQILDMVRRRGPFGQRIQAVPATGHPSRYWEQRAIIGGGFVDPRNITSTPGNPPRSERTVPLKAISGALNFGMFDVELGRLQGQYPNLTAKDLTDMVTGMLRTSDKALWRGTDTSLEIPTTTQYTGGFTQINRTFSVGSGVSMVDATKTEVASLMSSEDYEVRPTAIYAHPLTIDLYEQEEKQNHRQIPVMDLTNRDNEVIAGLKVSAISTAAGLLPLISDWTLPTPVVGGSVFESGKTDYPLAIISEELVEYHFLTSEEPRVYVLGLQGNLATQYVAVMFGAPVFKGKADPNNTPEVAASTLTYAHSVGYIVR